MQYRYMHHGHMYQDQEHMHRTCIHASGSRLSTIDMCIIHTCITVKDQGKLINASYMHISGSRVMDKCIIGMYIMVTCIRIKNIRIAHAYIHQVQESYMHACFRIKVQYHRYMHLHTCIRLLEKPCPSVRPSVRPSVTKFAASYTHAA